MCKKYLAIVLVLLIGHNLLAQKKNNTDASPITDLNDYLPLQVGNYWEYLAKTPFGPKYLGLTAMRDTIMPNGKTYIMMNEADIYETDYLGYVFYLRKDSNIVYRYYQDSIACSSKEFKYLDFNVEDSTVWSICRDLGPGEGNARGISQTFYDYHYYTYFNTPLETKTFEDIYLDNSDTIWTPGDGSQPISVSKRLGIIRQIIFTNGDYWLQGTIINGVKYGTITTVEKAGDLLPQRLTLQAYPNPFNISVTFNYYLPKIGYTNISIYNILGQNVATILDKERPVGDYSIVFNAEKLSSGTYYVLLRQNDLFTKQKIILIK